MFSRCITLGAVFLFLLVSSAPVRAEVLDKIDGSVIWMTSGGILVVAIAAGSFRPLAALTLYPLSLLFAYWTLDLIWSDVGPAIWRETGWSFFGPVSVAVVIYFFAPILAYAYFRWRRHSLRE
jgi:hypothetical protein